MVSTIHSHETCFGKLNNLRISFWNESTSHQYYRALIITPARKRTSTWPLVRRLIATKDGNPGVVARLSRTGWGQDATRNPRNQRRHREETGGWANERYDRLVVLSDRLPLKSVSEPFVARTPPPSIYKARRQHQHLSCCPIAWISRKN